MYQTEPPGGGGFVVRDLGSRNGTFVDGRRISAAKQVRMEETGTETGAKTGKEGRLETE